MKLSDLKSYKVISGPTVPTAPPAPARSAKEIATDVVKGAVKTGVQDLQDLGNIIAKPVGRVLGIQEDQIGIPEANLERHTTAERVGEGITRVAELAVPGSKVATATKALSFIPRVAIRAATDTAITAAQARGDLGQAGTAGAASAAIQTAAPVVGFASKLLGSLLKGAAGVASGRGTDVVEQILKTPQAAQAGLRTPVVDSLKADALKVRRYVAAMRKGSTTRYGTALEELPKRLGRAPEVIDAGHKTTIKVDGKTYTLSMQGVKSQFTQLLRGHGVTVDPKAKALDFLETRLSRPEENTLRQVFSDINRWKNTTPVGLDGLAAKINAYKRPGDTSPQLNGILGDLSQSVRGYIGKRVPAARAMVGRFQQEQTFLEELETHLGKVGNATSPIGIKNTAATLQTLFTKNKEMAREVLEKIPGGDQILGTQAGRELATQVPRSTSSIGSIMEGVLNAVIPPKVVGEFVAATGIAAEKAQPLFDTLQKLEPAARASVLEAVLAAVESQNRP